MNTVDDSSAGLPILEPNSSDDAPDKRPRVEHASAVNAWIVHLIRVSLFVTLLILIRQIHQKAEAEAEAQKIAPSVSESMLSQAFPSATRIKDWNSEGVAAVLDEKDQVLGSLLHTNQESRGILGYVGSTSLWIAINQNGEIQQVRILSSDDTPEHVRAINEDPLFLDQWNGMSWQEAAAKDSVDTVSGATLTSLAIVQSLRTRFGNSQPSLKFPDPVTIEEIQKVWNTAAQVDKEEGIDCIYRVTDKQGTLLGQFLRSSPYADSVHGYQGPSDLLIFLDAKGKYLRTAIRSSYDNMQPEPFVDYVKQDEYFLVNQFEGLTLEGLATYASDDVEGVSGATMTSQGVFDALQYTARWVQQQEAAKGNAKKASNGWDISFRDFGTLVVIVVAMILSFTRLKSNRTIRRVFFWCLVVYLGFLNGDMLSQTVMVGWTQNGIPWSKAFGLGILTLVALVIPVLTKQNVYCQAVCPFGAAQRLAGSVIRPKKKLPKGINRIGRFIPAVLLLLVAIVAITGLKWNLAAIEPFDAFSFRIAGWATLILAAVGLLGSFFIPMFYCRFGCPTGGILNYLRRTARSDRMGWSDALVILVLVLAIIYWV